MNRKVWASGIWIILVNLIIVSFINYKSANQFVTMKGILETLPIIMALSIPIVLIPAISLLTLFIIFIGIQKALKSPGSARRSRLAAKFPLASLIFTILIIILINFHIVVGIVSTTSRTYPYNIREITGYHSTRLVMGWSDTLFGESFSNPVPIVFSEDGTELYFKKREAGHINPSYFRISLDSHKIEAVNKSDLPMEIKYSKRDIREIEPLVGDAKASEYLEIPLSGNQQLIVLCIGSNRDSHECSIAHNTYLKTDSGIKSVTDNYGEYYLVVSDDGSMIAITDAIFPYSESSLYLLRAN